MYDSGKEYLLIRNILRTVISWSCIDDSEPQEICKPGIISLLAEEESFKPSQLSQHFPPSHTKPRGETAAN